MKEELDRKLEDDKDEGEGEDNNITGRSEF